MNKTRYHILDSKLVGLIHNGQVRSTTCKKKYNELSKKNWQVPHLERAMASKVRPPRPVKTPPMILPRAGTHLGETLNY